MQGGVEQKHQQSSKNRSVTILHSLCIYGIVFVAAPQEIISFPDDYSDDEDYALNGPPTPGDLSNNRQQIEQLEKNKFLE